MILHIVKSSYKNTIITDFPIAIYGYVASALVVVTENVNFLLHILLSALHSLQNILSNGPVATQSIMHTICKPGIAKLKGTESCGSVTN